MVDIWQTKLSFEPILIQTFPIFGPIELLLEVWQFTHGTPCGVGVPVGSSCAERYPQMACPGVVV